MEPDWQRLAALAHQLAVETYNEADSHLLAQLAEEFAQNARETERTKELLAA